MAIADIYQGNTKIFKFTFKDVAGNAIDITGWSLWFTAKDTEVSPDSSAAIQVSSTAGDNANDTPLSGIMYLTLSSVDTNITPQNLYYDFKRVIPGATPNVKTLDKGTFNIKKIITLST